MPATIPIETLELSAGSVIHTLDCNWECPDPLIAMSQAMQAAHKRAAPCFACLVAYRTAEGLMVVDYARDPKARILDLKHTGPTFEVRRGVFPPPPSSSPPSNDHEARIAALEAEVRTLQADILRLIKGPDED